MKTAERYANARHASNLKSEPRTSHSASDVLGAAGLAAQTHADAMALFSVVYGGGSTQKHALMEGLALTLTWHMLNHRLKGDPRKIAQQVIAYHLHAVCPACAGVGHQVVPGTITRANEPCSACNGLGKPAPPDDAAFVWLHNYIATLMAKASGKLRDKLGEM